MVSKARHCSAVPSGRHFAAKTWRKAGLSLPQPISTIFGLQWRKSAQGVRREKAALSSGCKAHPATAPAGSNRSRHGGDEMSEAFG
jgi:hypothetical protein